MVRIPAVEIFLKFYFSICLKIRVTVRVILEKVRGEDGYREGERPNILNIVASKNYLATFDSQ